MSTEMQFLANCRSLFMQIGITLSYSRPKCSTEYPEHEIFEGKRYNLASSSASVEGGSGVHKSKQFSRS